MLIENERTIGFVTDRDIVINCVASGYDLNQPVSYGMTRNIFCVKAKARRHGELA
jgi:signal-transduction protein with cAMP-binding, CBS, and nucleotidyltransferase domain